MNRVRLLIVACIGLLASIPAIPLMAAGPIFLRVPGHGPRRSKNVRLRLE